MSETTAGVLIVLICMATICFMLWLEHRSGKENNDDKD